MKVKFRNNDQQDFYSDLKTRVEAYFRKKGISPYANFEMVFKTFFFFTIWAASYILIITGFFEVHIMLLLVCILGFTTACLGFNVAHDATHGAYSARQYVNKILSYTFNLVGANNYIWSIMHNIVHHTYTNIPEHDEDLNLFPLIRLSTEKKLFKIHRYQHWYAFFFYCFTSLSWVFFKDYKKFFQKRIGNYNNKKHPAREYFILFISKAVYYFLFILLPVLFLNLPWWTILTGFFIMHMVEGITLAVVFQLAHTVEGPEFPTPAQDGSIENGWVIHQLKTTANFARKSFLVNFFAGGLNFQIEHHIFPKICHIHYKAISDIVKKTTEEYKLPYIENRTFFEAIVSHVRLLKRLGRI